jgi:hypothetical protein
MPVIMLENVEPLRLGIPGIIMGIILLLFGRKLFWFFVAVIGFYLGLVFATNYFNAESNWHGIIIAICCGAAGVVILYLLQKIALSIFGFFAGVLITFHLTEYLHLPFHWWSILLGGILGMIIMASLFQLAVILFSSFFGSYMIMLELPSGFTAKTTIFVILALIGSLVQYSMMKKNKEKGEAPKSDD